ncbi:MAG: hypothetical protein WCH31_03480 [Actinomycetes bacterium]
MTSVVARADRRGNADVTSGLAVQDGFVRGSRNLRFAVAVAAATGVLASAATASAPPVGPLPAGPVVVMRVPKGNLFSVALASRSTSTGLVWRGAHPVNNKVAVPLWEADVGQSVVLVYRAVGLGTTTIVYGLTRGETYKAYAAVRYRVTVVTP